MVRQKTTTMLCQFIDVFGKDLAAVKSLINELDGGNTYVLTNVSGYVVKNIRPNNNNYFIINNDKSVTLSSGQVYLLSDLYNFDFDGQKLTPVRKKVRMSKQILAGDLLKLITENFPEGTITLFDPDLNVIFTQGEGYAKYGMDPDLLIGKNAKDFLLPEILKGITAFSNDLKPDDTVSFEAAYEKSIYRNTIKAISDQKGIIEYYLLRTVDVTVMKSQSDEIRRQKNKYESIFSALDRSALVSITSKNGSIQHVNKAFVDTYGYNKNELIGENHNTLSSNHHPGHFWKNLWETISVGGIWRNEIKNVAKNGSAIWVDTVIAPIYDAKQQIEGYLNVAYPITEKKELEISLKESEAQFKYMVEASQEIVAVHEPDGRYKYVSPALERVTGFKPSEMVGVNPYAYFHPDDVKRIEEDSHNPVLRGEKNKNIQYRFRIKSGEYLWFDTYIDPIFNDHGEVVSLLTGSRDITALKEYELDLEESKQKLIDITDSIPGAVIRYVLHPDGTDAIEFASRGVEQLWQLSPEEVIKDASKAWSRVHPDDINVVKKSIENSVASLSFWNTTYRMVFPDGKVKWHSAFGNPKKLPNGNILFNTIVNDVTEIKEAEFQHLKALNQLQLAVDTANLGVWELDLSTRKLQWNNQIMKIYESTDEHFGGHIDDFLNAVHRDDVALARSELDKIIRGEVVKNVRYRILTPQGKVKHIYASGSPLKDDQGKVTRLIGINLDVSQIVHFEEQLKEALEQKDSLFIELHHRIKNNLQMVSSLMFIKSDTEKDPRLESFVKETSARINSISTIHEQLLQMQEVNRLDAAHYLSELARRLVNTYSLDRKKIELVQNCKRHVLSTDIVLTLGLVLNEVISNSIKHAYSEDQPGRVHLNFHKSDGRYTLEIYDEGIGLPEEVLHGKNLSYGMQLIHLFSDQINAELTIENRDGAYFNLCFQLD